MQKRYHVRCKPQSRNLYGVYSLGGLGLGLKFWSYNIIIDELN
jgi:hypothetical protein